MSDKALKKLNRWLRKYMVLLTDEGGHGCINR
jgi:hypothetical protein